MDMNLMEFVRPELLVLIPVLYIIGMGLKRSEVVLDKRIPFILGAVGIFLSALYILSTADITGWQSGVLATFTILTQGILTAGASVYVNQLVVQTKKGE